MMRAVVVVVACALIGGAAGIDAWHPEWGPSPPVAPYTMANLPSQKVTVRMIFPVLGVSRWSDGYNEVRGKFRHTGIDIKAPKMTPIVAPFSGKLGMKRESFWIYGDNGWLMLGTHLNDDNLGTHDHKGDRDVMFAPNLHANQHVVAGQFIGYVGESGDATAPHLHFEIYAPGSGSTLPRIRDPFLALKSAQRIARPVTVVDNRQDRPGKGHVRLVGCVRKIDEQLKMVTLLVTAIQDVDGQTIPITDIRYRQVKLSDDQVGNCGGWRSLRTLAECQTVSAYVSATSDATVRDAVRFVVDPRVLIIR